MQYTPRLLMRVMALICSVDPYINYLEFDKYQPHETTPHPAIPVCELHSI